MRNDKRFQSGRPQGLDYGGQDVISLHGSGFLGNRLFAFYEPDLS
jgi:hypothetical protein